MAFKGGWVGLMVGIFLVCFTEHLLFNLIPHSCFPSPPNIFYGSPLSKVANDLGGFQYGHGPWGCLDRAILWVSDRPNKLVAVLSGGGRDGFTKLLE